MTKTEKVAPFKSLDILRGFAALWVVMCHAADHYVAGTQWESYPLYAVSLRGQLGVVLFFLISGYCIVGAAYSAFASGKKVRRYAYERARRIYPPYFFTMVLALVYAGSLIVAQRHHLIPPVHHPLDVSGGVGYWAANLLIVQWETGQPFLNVNFWSLCYEIVFYAIVGAILLAAQRMEKKWSAQAGLWWFSMAIAGLTFASLGWQIATGTEGVFPADRWYQFGLGGLFFLAVEIRREGLAGYSAKLERTNRAMVAAAAVLTGVFAMTRSLGGIDIGHPSSRMQGVAVLVFLAMFWVLRSTEGRWAHRRILGPLFWLGSFSYSLYLVHPYFLGLVDVPARRVGLVENLYVVSWALQIVAAVIAAWVFYLVVERRFVSSRQKQRIAAELGRAAE